jgi:hypothetical protein
VVDLVLHATDPAELVVALGTDHVVAASLLFLDDEATLWTVRDRVLDAEVLEVFLHGLVKLCLAILLSMVGQAAPHANLILASLALAMILVGPREARIRLFLDLVLEPLAVERAAGEGSVSPRKFAKIHIVALAHYYLLTLLQKLGT